MKMTTNGQSQSAKKVYQKATMEIVEIGAVDVVRTSGDPTMHGNGGQSFKNLKYERHGANSDIFAD